MKKYIRNFLTVTFVLLIAANAIANENIIINPANQNPIEVMINVPLNVYPPLNVTLIDWATNGASSYNISIVQDSSHFVNCSFTGPITGSIQTVNLNGCVLNDGENYTIYAEAYCPQGNCTNPFRSKLLRIDSGINPIPELITFVLVGMGLIGLIGLVKLRK